MEYDNKAAKEIARMPYNFWTGYSLQEWEKRAINVLLKTRSENKAKEKRAMGKIEKIGIRQLGLRMDYIIIDEMESDDE